MKAFSSLSRIQQVVTIAVGLSILGGSATGMAVKAANAAHTKIVVAMNDREVERVQQAIRDWNTKITETKYRSDITEQQKDLLITDYSENIRVLKLKEACYLRGELNC